MNSDKKFQMKFTNGLPLEKSMYPGLDEHTYIVKAGSIQKAGAKPLPVDIQVDQDTQIPLRDGTIIRADIYRPTTGENFPTIMWYAPYGKRGSFLNMDNFNHPTRMDVPTTWEDGLNSFEAPNPSDWVKHGYVVISPDPRGVGSSEGNAYAWGSQQATDEYDVIEWIGEQPWSNGKVGLTGTSYLAMSQYAVAELQPSHLAAIAPWEGAFNPYKESLARGGIADTSFNASLSSAIFTNNQVEDMATLGQEHPFYDAYWQDKTPDLHKVTIPAYLVGSWTNAVHSLGSYKAFDQLGSTEKWLRVHNTHEWNDYYNPENVADLRKFFDRYLKGIDNGWEETPKVRLSVLNPGHADIINRPEKKYPLDHSENETFHLAQQDNDFVLQKNPQQSKGSVSYDADASEGVTFKLKIPTATEIVGELSLKLYVEAADNDDMDLFAFVRKLDAEGNPLEPQVVTDRPYPGPNGRLRVSMRKLDPNESNNHHLELAQTNPEKLKTGEVVAVTIPFWPFGMKWEAGETLALTIGPKDKIVRPEFPQLPPSPNINHGRHIIHFGGNFDAKLTLPKINLNNQ
ncbi:CocE/NonD family hydrolase [Levilactobacillus brevis]|uniref:CocE/NonD family hydrolase n=1 Tax=Levilactobacillus brevis TaxID=1580 RepID=UPI001BA9314F|nr:CocE/NonD family hydrolase [Levilactobacillus brevis]MBS1005519.1 CocE/NonD family hydrolase [Levilactobacillus brevis]